MTVLVVGEALVDVVQRLGAEPERHAGGSPFNVAVGLGRLGAPARLATQLADDEPGELLRSRLQASAVGLESLSPVPLRTLSAVVTLSADGGATYDFDVTWDPDEMPDPALFEAVHVGSLGAAVSPGASLVADLVVSADALGVPVSFDPNVRLEAAPDLTLWRRSFASIAAHARIIKMSDEDARALFPGVALPDLARRLALDGCLAVITRGADGSYAAAGDHDTLVRSPAVEVADTIGAGDSFMAALLAGLRLRGWPRADELTANDLADLASYAGRAAAITCSRVGADPPTLAELT